MLCYNMLLTLGLYILLLTIALLFLIIKYLKWHFKYWQRLNVPDITPVSMIYGNMKELILQKLSLTEAIQKHYENFKRKKYAYGGLFMAIKPFFIVIDPHNIKRIMVNDFEYFTDRGENLASNNGTLSDSLLNLKGQNWQSIRNRLGSMFTSRKMVHIFPKALEYSQKLDILLEAMENEAVDIDDIGSRFIADVIASYILGIDCNNLEYNQSEVAHIFNRIKTMTKFRTFKTVFSYIFPKISKFLRIRVEEPEIENFFINTVTKMVKYRKDNQIFHNDVLDLLIHFKKDNDFENINKSVNNLTLRQIIAECYTLSAGHGTNTMIFTMCMYELAKNLEVQEKLKLEIKQVLENHKGLITFETVTKMKYMDKVISETLRLHPPIPLTTRECTQDYKIAGTDCLIKKGTRVLIPIRPLHMDQEYYPEPECFEPERFSEDNIRERKPFTYLPFGDGPRNCIAIRFGLMNVKIGLIALLNNRKWTIHPQMKLPLKLKTYSVLHQFENTILLRFNENISK